MRIGLLQAAFGILTALAVVRCSVFGDGGCDPAVDFTPAIALKKAFLAGGTDGPVAGLVYANPIEASNDPNFGIASSGIDNLLRAFKLPGLLNPSSLDTDFIKIRTKQMTESDLAAPNANGVFVFDPSSPKYSQLMAAYSVRSEMQYLEALGFPFCKERPLYVFSRVDSDVANALYDHGYLTPQNPRTMRMYGAGNFTTGADARMYHHELGHMFNECTSHERKIDFAGDNGAAYTEGAALHECLADYVALTFGERTQLGEWLNHNYSDTQAGEPLRRSVDSDGNHLKFSDVGFGSDANGIPGRYKVSEWCLRSLWDIRTAMVAKNGDFGAAQADYLIFSGLSLLQQDTSMLQFAQAIDQADRRLFCGGNKSLVRSAFEGRDFSMSPTKLVKPLDVSIRQVGVTTSNGQQTQGSPRPGGQLTFTIRLQNNDTENARNVRVRLTSSSTLLVPTTYMQGYGDIAPNATVTVGNGGFSLDYSVWANIDRSATPGVAMRYAIEVLVENGETRRLEGALSL